MIFSTVWQRSKIFLGGISIGYLITLLVVLPMYTFGLDENHDLRIYFTVHLITAIAYIAVYNKVFKPVMPTQTLRNTIVCFFIGCGMAIILFSLSQVPIWIAANPLRFIVWKPSLIDLFILTLTIAIFEEALFRYYLQRLFSATFGVLIGTLLQALWFVSSHEEMLAIFTVPNSDLIFRWLTLFSSAIFLTVIAYSRFGLGAAIGLHFMLNFFIMYFFGMRKEFQAYMHSDFVHGVMPLKMDHHWLWLMLSACALLLANRVSRYPAK